VNTRAIRVLLPPAVYGILYEMRTGKSCVLSRGPWPAERRAEAIEIMFDDGSVSPFALHLTPESLDLLPGGQRPVVRGFVRRMLQGTASRTRHWRESATGDVSMSCRTSRG
jgi:hypothetical protein